VHINGADDGDDVDHDYHIAWITKLFLIRREGFSLTVLENKVLGIMK
jgi:hypothetical protein